MRAKAMREEVVKVDAKGNRDHLKHLCNQLDQILEAEAWGAKNTWFGKG